MSAGLRQRAQVRVGEVEADDICTSVLEGLHLPPVAEPSDGSDVVVARECHGQREAHETGRASDDDALPA
jgi:hypothetical protein